MASNATPRNLDPKFKDETQETPETLEAREREAVAKQETEREAAERQAVEREAKKKDETPMIVHRQRYIDNDGNPNEREIRMPASEWPAYEKEHNL